MASIAQKLGIESVVIVHHRDANRYHSSHKLACKSRRTLECKDLATTTPRRVTCPDCAGILIFKFEKLIEQLKFYRDLNEKEIK